MSDVLEAVGFVCLCARHSFQLSGLVLCLLLPFVLVIISSFFLSFLFFSFFSFLVESALMPVGSFLGVCFALLTIQGRQCDWARGFGNRRCAAPLHQRRAKAEGRQRTRTSHVPQAANCVRFALRFMTGRICFNVSHSHVHFSAPSPPHLPHARQQLLINSIPPARLCCGCV